MINAYSDFRLYCPVVYAARWTVTSVILTRLLMTLRNYLKLKASVEPQIKFHMRLMLKELCIMMKILDMTKSIILNTKSTST